MSYDQIVDFLVRIGFPIFVILVVGWGVAVFTVKYAWPFVTKLISDSIVAREKERQEHLAAVSKIMADREAERNASIAAIQRAELERLNERVKFNEILGGFQGVMKEQTTEFGRTVGALTQLTTVITDLKNSDERRQRDVLEALETVRRQLSK